MVEAQAHITKIERKSLLTINRNVFSATKARKTKNSAAQIVESYEISDSEEENGEPSAAERQVCLFLSRISIRSSNSPSIQFSSEIGTQL